MSRPTSLSLRALRLGRMVMHLLRGLATLGFVFPRVTQPRRDGLIRAWGAKLLRNFSVRLVVDAPPGFDLRAGRRLMVGNHVSWLDIFALQAVVAARFVAKAELATWPVLGRLIRQSGTVFIERTRRADTLRINHAIAAHLAAGEVVAVFPEGTTSDGRALRKFHANLFQAAVEAEAEVVPFCLRYRDERGNYSAAPAFIDDLTFWQSIRRVLRERRLTCELTIFAPLERAGRSRRELAAAAEQMVAERLRGHSRQDR